MNRKARSATITAFLLVGISLIPGGRLLAAPFTCAPDTYQITVNQLKLASIDLTATPGTVTYSNVGTANTHQINAIGYNYDDNLIYGIENIVTGAAVTANNLLQIDASGARVNLGPVTSLPAANYIAGDYDGAGHWIVASNLGNAYSINLATKVATSIGTLSPGPGDFAIINYSRINSGSAITGFYVSGSNLYRFDAMANPVGATLVGSIGASTINAGAMWADSGGRVTAFDNNTGSYFLIDDPTSAPLTFELVASGDPVYTNDGAFCLLAASPFSDDSEDGGSEEASGGGGWSPVDDGYLDYQRGRVEGEGSTDLPNTGGSANTLNVIVGLGCLAAGSTLVAASRRRRYS